MIKKNNTSFKGDVLRMISGTGLTQIISLAAAPILTRLFAPEAFGIAAIFAAITGIVGSIVCLRYEQAIVLPKDDREAANILGLSLFAALFISGLTAIVVLSIGFGLFDVLNVPELYAYRWLIPVAILIGGIYYAFQFWSTRAKHFSRISVSMVFGGVSTTGSSLSLGFMGYTAGASLIAASVGGQFVSAVVLASRIWRQDSQFILSSLSGKAVWAALKRYKKFPLYGGWSILLGNGAWLLPTILMGFFFSPVFVGLYALGFRVLQIPTGLIGSSIGQVFLQASSDAKKDGSLPEMLENVFEKLVALSMVPFLVLAVIGQDLYALVFGEVWKEAGLYTQILAPWAFLWFLSSPLTGLFSIMEKQDLQLKWNVANFLIRISSIVVGAYLDSAVSAVIALGVTGVFVYGYKLVLSFRIAGSSLKSAARILKKYLLFSIAPVAITQAFVISDVDTILKVVVAVLCVLVSLLMVSKEYLAGVLIR